MPKENEFGTRARIAQLFRTIIESPNRYTKRQLAERFGVSTDTIEGDFKAIGTADFQLKNDDRGRYAFVLSKPHRQLKDLLHFSAEDQALLYQAIDNLPGHTDRQQNLKKKLASLYDYGLHRKFLGLSNFILGFYHQGIEIIAPESLRTYLREAVGKMNF